jgi:hypothetical protein
MIHLNTKHLRCRQLIDAKIGDIGSVGWMVDKVMAFERNGQSLPTKSKS